MSCAHQRQRLYMHPSLLPSVAPPPNNVALCVHPITETHSARRKDPERGASDSHPFANRHTQSTPPPNSTYTLFCSHSRAKANCEPSTPSAAHRVSHICLLLTPRPRRLRLLAPRAEAKAPREAAAPTQRAPAAAAPHRPRPCRCLPPRPLRAFPQGRRASPQAFTAPRTRWARSGVAAAATAMLTLWRSLADRAAALTVACDGAPLRIRTGPRQGEERRESRHG